MTSRIARLSLTESKLMTRDVGLLVSTVLVPLLVLLGWGSVPGIREASPDLGGLRPLEAVIAPIAVTLSFATLALFALPTYLAGYREKGVLRRLQATPVGPGALLTAQLLVNVAFAVVATVVAIAGGALIFDMGLPQHMTGFVLTMLLGTSALFAVGLLIAAVSPTASAASGIGSLLFFPLMLLGGLFVPLEQLPETFGRIGRLTPLGAALQAVRDTWGGAAPEPRHLAVMAVTAVVAGVLATRLFRWE